jgi:3'-phosphoadenosine 5'-phosphosulfate sulfotransferase (PAPS reductase)/FAD synthetase
MKENIKAKAIISLIISFIAFGFGTGASVFSGLYLKDANNSYFTNNSTGEFPIIYNVKNTSDNETNIPTITQTPSHSNSENTNNGNNQQNPPVQPPTNSSTNNTH